MRISDWSSDVCSSDLKEVYDMNTSIQAFRDACEKGAARFGSVPQGVNIQADVIQGIKSEWLQVTGANPDKIIMYVHGGGYVSEIGRASCRERVCTYV